MYQIGEKVGARNTNKDQNRREVKFSCVTNLPGKPYQFIAVGNERTIYTENESIKIPPRPTLDGTQKQPELPQIDRHLSQIVMHNSGKVFFAGVGDHSNPCPGAIQIWKLPFEKANEI